MPLASAPACLPVARGALPHSLPREALDLLRATTPDFLTWPRLPRSSITERIDVQSAAGFPGLVIDTSNERVYVQRDNAEAQLDQLALAYLAMERTDTALLPQPSLGLAELQRWLNEEQFGGRTLLGQICGPVSLGLLLVDDDERPLAYDQILLEALVQHLALCSTWHCDQLAGFGAEVGLTLEEPFLFMSESPLSPFSWEEGLDLIERVLGAVTGRRALAPGVTRGWSDLLTLSVDMVVVESHHVEALNEVAPVLRAFLDRQGTIAWGLVPNDASLLARERVPTLCAQYQVMLTALAASGIPAEQVLAASLITTTGPLDQLTPETASVAQELCAEVSAQLRQRYELEGRVMSDEW